MLEIIIILCVGHLISKIQHHQSRKQIFERSSIFCRFCLGDASEF